MKTKRKTKKRQMVHRTAGLPMVSGHRSVNYRKRKRHSVGGLGSSVGVEVMDLVSLAGGYIVGEILIEKTFTKIDPLYKSIGAAVVGVVVPRLISKKSSMMNEIGRGVSLAGVTSVLKSMNIVGSIGNIAVFDKQPMAIVDQVAAPVAATLRDGIKQTVGYSSKSYQSLSHIDGF